MCQKSLEACVETLGFRRVSPGTLGLGVVGVRISDRDFALGYPSKVTCHKSAGSKPRPLGH